MAIVSPLHEYDYVMCQNASMDRYIISEGNGLYFTQVPCLCTDESDGKAFGLFTKENALRAFHNGQVTASLGIKAPRMLCVLEVDKKLTIGTRTTRPCLLQYDVECPFLIADAAFYERFYFEEFYQKWTFPGIPDSDARHLVAARILAKDLRIMRNAQIPHRTMSVQNITWTLELLNVGHVISSTCLYTEPVEPSYAQEVLCAYQIIKYIAGVLVEDVDYQKIDSILRIMITI